jgi:hypothetical protein
MLQIFELLGWLYRVSMLVAFLTIITSELMSVK